jgi:hypothetical protein
MHACQALLGLRPPHCARQTIGGTLLRSVLCGAAILRHVCGALYTAGFNSTQCGSTGRPPVGIHTCCAELSLLLPGPVVLLGWWSLGSLLLAARLAAAVKHEPGSSDSKHHNNNSSSSSSSN